MPEPPADGSLLDRMKSRGLVTDAPDRAAAERYAAEPDGQLSEDDEYDAI